MKRRDLLVATVAMSGSVQFAYSNPKIYPDKVVKIMAFGEPGAPLEVVSRIYAEYFRTKTNGTFIVETKPGAGGILAADAVAKSKPDGHTLFFTTPSTQVILPSIQKIPYDPIEQFTYLTPVGIGGPALIVKADCPANNIAEFIDLAKKKGRLTYGTWGHGTLPHLVTEVLKFQTNAPFEHVPYKGQSKAHIDMLGDILDSAWANPATAKALLLDGNGKQQIKILGITGTQRASIIPDVSTFAEQGYKGVFETDSWFGFLAPAKISEFHSKEIHNLISSANNDPAIKQKLIDMGLEPTIINMEDFKKSIVQDLKNWQAVIKDLKI